MMSPKGTSIAVGALIVLFPVVSSAVNCTVPSASHPTIKDAIDDISCTEIVLGSQVFAESVTIDRSLEMRGASSAATIIEGRVLMEGGSTQVVVRDLKVDGSAPSVAGCFRDALVADGGAQLGGTNIIVVNGDGDACLVFGDGFESGDTTAWSSTTP